MPSTLVGRENHLLTLEALIDDTAAGSGATVVLEGEAGIGKTRLANEAAALAEQRGFVVYRGEGEQLESFRPFGVVGSALGVLRPTGSDTAIADLVSGTRPEAAPAELLEFRIVAAIVDHIERLASRSPLLLLLEDVHWADKGTLHVVREASRIVSGLAALVVCTTREAAVLGPMPDVVAIDLEPLTNAEVGVLAESVLGYVPGANLSAHLGSAAGNPLFVTEILGGIARSGDLRVADGAADVAAFAVSTSLRLTIQHRLSYMDAATVEVLQVASVLGPRFAMRDLASLYGRPSASLVAAIREAADAGVIHDVGDALAFRHELIREALYADIAATVRIALHHDAGRVLAEAGAPATLVAEHLVRAAAPGDDETVRWLERAAAETSARSPTDAATLYERALALVANDDPRRDAVETARVRCLMNAGRLQDAAESAQRLLGRTTDQDIQAELRTVAVESMIGGGRAADVIALTERWRQTGRFDDARADATLAWAICMTGDFHAAREPAQRALTGARACADDFTAGLALGALGLSSMLLGDLDEAASLFDRAIAAGGDVPVHWQHLPLSAARAYLLMQLDRLDEGVSAAHEALRRDTDAGVVRNLGIHHWVCGFGAYTQGRLDDAAAELQAGIEAATEWCGFDAGLRGLLAMVNVAMGDLDKAALMVEEGSALLTSSPMGLTELMVGRALHADASGQPDVALTLFANVWDVNAALGVTLNDTAADTARLAVRVGDADRAESIAQAMVASARRNPSVPSIAATAVFVRSLIDADADGLLRAAELYRPSTRPLPLAACLVDAAEALAKSGRTSDARHVLDEAVGICERIGARAAVARAEARLRAAGVRRGRRGVRTRATMGWDALTPTERTVAGHVSEGLTNPQIADRMFLSRWTVQTHVKHALAKLQVRSRTELGVEARRH